DEFECAGTVKKSTREKSATTAPTLPAHLRPLRMPGFRTMPPPSETCVSMLGGFYAEWFPFDSLCTLGVSAVIPMVRPRNTAYISFRFHKDNDRSAQLSHRSPRPAGLAYRQIRPCAPFPVPFSPCAGSCLRCLPRQWRPAAVDVRYRLYLR